MPVYIYQGQFYVRLYNNFQFEIEADSTEDANAKAEEYFRNEANHESMIKESDENYDKLRMPDLKQYFLENAQVDSAYRDADEELEEETEEIEVCMSMED